MPANLPPQYFEAEKNLRMAKTAAEKIVAIEEMLAIIPKHKGTDHLRAELRAKIAKLTELSTKKSGARRTSMTIEKEGAAQVAVIGLTNTGKSQLVGSITNASPVVADYPFATQIATPGMMEFENIKIQLIDTPPLAPQTIQFWLPPMLRRADALLVMIDLQSDPLVQMEATIAHLEKMRISITDSKSQVEEYAILEHKKALVVGNKIDLPQARQNYAVMQNKYEQQLPVTSISAREHIGLEELKLRIYQTLDIIRVYTKTPSQKPDFNDPIILNRESTLEDAAATVHKDFRSKLKYARVWGSGKHDGVMVKRDHILQDGDIIELHL
ncbi:MAG: 50S ribosome-binding GTPase [Dehalococcoidales bacterium]|nr:50S ribosome-binding GTPase [Dehalococcoidales bacterium]